MERILTKTLTDKSSEKHDIETFRGLRSSNDESDVPLRTNAFIAKQDKELDSLNLNKLKNQTDSLEFLEIKPITNLEGNQNSVKCLNCNDDTPQLVSNVITRFENVTSRLKEMSKKSINLDPASKAELKYHIQTMKKIFEEANSQLKKRPSSEDQNISKFELKKRQEENVIRMIVLTIQKSLNNLYHNQGIDAKWLKIIGNLSFEMKAKLSNIMNIIDFKVVEDYNRYFKPMDDALKQVLKDFIKELLFQDEERDLDQWLNISEIRQKETTKWLKNYENRRNFYDKIIKTLF